MKPILILQHLSADGPAHFGTWLQRQGVPFEVRNTEAGDGFPDHLHEHAALAVLGDEDMRAQMAAAGRAFATQHQGATRRTIELLRGLQVQSPAPRPGLRAPAAR